MMDRPIRVAYVFGGDIRPYRVPFLDSMAERGVIDVTVYAGRPPPRFGAPDREPEVGVEVERVVNHFWPGGSGRVVWQRGLLDVLRSDCQVIVCSEIVSNLSVWAIRFLHRLVGKRLVLIGYFFRPQHEFRFRAIRSFLRRRLRRTAGALIPYTEAGARDLRSDGVEDDRIFVLRNTLDTERLMAFQERVGPAEEKQARRRLDVDDEDDVIVFLGRLRGVKRLDVLIEAMRRLRAYAEPTPFLVVIGDGPDRHQLERQAEGLPVRFLGPLYSEPEIAPYLAISDLMVLPGQVGLTCIHGFAAGLPCVTTSGDSVTQSPEFEYLDGSNSVVLEDLDVGRLASTIRRLLDDRQQLARLSAGATGTARRLTMGAMVDAFESAVKKAVSGRPSDWA